MIEAGLDFGQHKLNDDCDTTEKNPTNLLSFDGIFLKIITAGLRPSLKKAVLRELGSDNRVIFGVPRFYKKARDFYDGAIINLVKEEYSIDRVLPNGIIENVFPHQYQCSRYNELVVVKRVPSTEELRFISCGRSYDVLAGTNSYEIVEQPLTNDWGHRLKTVSGAQRQSYLRDSFTRIRRVELLV